eukprot:TRINITY_DN25379_c0_g1_i1.p1 TRINITY_DN25379_c0_g1~~TRINITY_DN25379_c0_g1_i1.p1  ORF type:complete len:159 (+),score=13.53 TRINITY_DN25379_c0_g1_i1:112-588(+)
MLAPCRTYQAIVLWLSISMVLPQPEGEEEIIDWRSWPGGSVVAARMASEEGLDWRHLDGKLAFQDSFLHPTHTFSYRNMLGEPFRTMGMPLVMGWEAAWRSLDGRQPTDSCRLPSAPAHCHGPWSAEVGEPISFRRMLVGPVAEFAVAEADGMTEAGL